jgi:hypothetical protein
VVLIFAPHAPSPDRIGATREVAELVRVKKPQLNEYVPDGLRAVQDYVTTELE